MPGLPDNVLTSLLNVPQEPRLAQAYLQPIDLAPGEDNPFFGFRDFNDLGSSPGIGTRGAIAFQYWPESVQDSRPSEWGSRNIPGGSHPLKQWTNGGDRTVSFTAIFTTDTDPGDEFFEGWLGLSPYESVGDIPLNGLELGTRDVDLRAVVSWLRWYTYPYYDSGGVAYEPAKCLLVMPQTKLGHDGTDYIVAVMTTCDVTYEEWFPSGFPRIIEVNLEFSESVQEGTRVRFHNRRDMVMASEVASFLATRGTNR